MFAKDAMKATYFRKTGRDRGGGGLLGERLFMFLAYLPNLPNFLFYFWETVPLLLLLLMSR